jgi:hypothetical protein
VSTNPTSVAVKTPVVYAADKNVVTHLRKMKSKEAIAVWKTLNEKSPRVKKPKVQKVAKALRPCIECGLVLVKKLYCGAACKQAGWRKGRHLSPAQLKEKDRLNRIRLQFDNENTKRALSASNGMAFDGRNDAVGRTPKGRILIPPPEKEKIEYPVEAVLQFSVERVAEKYKGLGEKSTKK